MTIDRVFDRQVHLDERSRAYAVTAPKPMPPVEELTRMKRRWTPARILDQGREGHCVGFGVSGELGATPEPRAVDDEFAHAMFYAAQAVDRRSGRWYQDGATLLAGCVAAKEAGLISRFEWAFTYQQYLYGLMRRRPALHGVSWLRGMFSPDSRGLLSISGDVLGGHAIYSVAYFPAHRSPFGFNTVEIVQSWGTDHGDQGRVFVRAEPWWELLRDGGETAFLIDKRLPR